MDNNNNNNDGKKRLSTEEFVAKTSELALELVTYCANKYDPTAIASIDDIEVISYAMLKAATTIFYMSGLKPEALDRYYNAACVETKDKLKTFNFKDGKCDCDTCNPKPNKDFN